MSIERQNPDGTYSPAEPIGWMEEHNRWQRLLFWLMRTPHCNDEALRRLTARAASVGTKDGDDDA